MAIERFEDMVAWQRARKLTRTVYQLTRHPRFERDYGLANQIQRAAVSAMANIAEGFERRSRKEFANFLNIALSSAAEVKSHLYVALDQEYVEPSEFEGAYDQCSEVARLTLGLKRSVSKTS